MTTLASMHRGSSSSNRERRERNAFAGNGDCLGPLLGRGRNAMVNTPPEKITVSTCQPLPTCPFHHLRAIIADCRARGHKSGQKGRGSAFWEPNRRLVAWMRRPNCFARLAVARLEGAQPALHGASNEANKERIEKDRSVGPRARVDPRAPPCVRGGSTRVGGPRGAFHLPLLRRRPSPEP